MGLGPQKLTQLVDLLGHLLSRNHVSNFSDLGPPHPLKMLGGLNNYNEQNVIDDVIFFRKLKLGRLNWEIGPK